MGISFMMYTLVKKTDLIGEFSFSDQLDVCNPQPWIK